MGILSDFGLFPHYNTNPGIERDAPSRKISCRAAINRACSVLGAQWRQQKSFMSKILLIIGLALTLLVPQAGKAAEQAGQNDDKSSAWQSGSLDAILGFGIITGWGVERWKWFRQSFHTVDEHGFSNRSKTGGSDKTGHFMSSYLISELLTTRLVDRQYSIQEAALTSSVYAAGLMTWIEIGDASSRYGFSQEDLLADYLGIGMSYLLQTVPEARKKIDLRIEYWPSSGPEKNKDIVADYSGMKHLMALKFSGFDWSQGNPLQYLEWQLGYYSRGYRSFDKGERERVVYTALGINLSRFLDPDQWKYTSLTLRYLQVPYTYAPYNIHRSSSDGKSRN